MTLWDWAWLNAEDFTWGEFAGAVARHSAALRRPPPPPIEQGTNGTPRPTVEFVEWMMMLPAGHVVDIDLSRTRKLKALGNGVVPAQAAHAIRALHPDRLEPRVP